MIRLAQHRLPTCRICQFPLPRCHSAWLLVFVEKFLTCDAERLKKLKRSTTYLLRHWGPVMNAALIITLTFFDD